VGAHVDVAGNGRIAVAMVSSATQPYAALLMDLQMPEMDGFEATQAIRADARHARLPILAMTAHAMAEERERCLAAGMNDHIAKPIDPDTLFQVLARWIGATPARSAPRAVAPAPQAGAVSIPGVDVAAGLQRVAGNRKLYENLLRQFLQGQRDAAERIETALAAQDRAGAERIAHNVKGVAGNLGSGAVQEMAAQLERALREGADAAALERLLPRFAASMATLADAIGTALAPDEEQNTPTATAIDWEAFKPILAKLRAYLTSDDSEATDYFDAQRGAFKAACTADDFAQLDKLLHAFEFGAALLLLEQKFAEGAKE